MEKKQNGEKCTGTFTKRIGNTTYRVNVHFAEETTDTVEDKLLHLMGTVHSRIITFFSISVISYQSSLSYRLISKACFGRFFAISACSNAFARSTINCTCSLPK